MKLFVLGTAEDVRGFGLAGVEGRAAETPEEARRFLEQIASAPRDVGLLLISEATARLAPGQVERLARGRRSPAIVLLPGAPR